MTIEEIEKLSQGFAEAMKKLPDDSVKEVSKADRKQKYLLTVKIEMLRRIREAKEKGNANQEIRTTLDYSLFETYGHRNPFLLLFMRGKTRWYGM
jgi:hypothetical protein